MTPEKSFLCAALRSCFCIALMIGLEAAAILAVQERAAEEQYFGNRGTQIHQFIQATRELGICIVRDHSAGVAEPLVGRIGIINLNNGASLPSFDSWIPGPSVPLPRNSSAENRPHHSMDARCALSPCRQHPSDRGTLHCGSGDQGEGSQGTRLEVGRLNCQTTQWIAARILASFSPEGSCPQRVLKNGQTQFLYMAEKDILLEFGKCLMAWRPDCESPIWLRQFPGDGLHSVQASQGQVYCGLASGRVLQLDAESGEILTNRVLRPQTLRRTAVSGCGQLLVTVWADQMLVVSRILDGQTIWSDRTNPQLFTPAVSPKGKILVMADPDQETNLIISDLSKRNGHRISLQHRGAVGACFPDEDHILTWGLDGRLRFWAVESGHLEWEQQEPGS